MIGAKRRQAGIAFPPPRKQNYVLIIRLDIIPVNNPMTVSNGLRRLCTFLEHIDRGIIQMEDKTDKGETVWSTLSKNDFTATIGFGKRFFKKQNILEKCPKYLYNMSEPSELGDIFPYTLQQTDMILQLASNDYSVNRLVLQNDSYLRYSKQYPTKYQTDSFYSEEPALDIMGSLFKWARLTDVQSGFHRTDGRNLMGFYDGISNPDRLIDDIWISDDEDPVIADGTYMVFQKIEHDLRQWDQLDIRAQEKWVGRSKATGLLLGTLSAEEEKKLTSDLRSDDLVKRRQAMARMARLVDEQRDPIKRLFDPYDLRYNRIYKICPVLSHVRKANPRERNKKRSRFLLRRGYLYVQEEFEEYPRSGLLFISFQKDIKIFEDMKKNLAQQINHSITTNKLTDVKNYSNQKAQTDSFNTQTLGGGYYFIPRIPAKGISEIGQTFFM